MSISFIVTLYINIKVKFSRYRPGVAQRVGRGIALLFHDRGTRSGWVVSSTPRPLFTPGKGTIPILQEAEWAPGPVWTGGNSRAQRDSIPDRPARSRYIYIYIYIYIERERERESICVWLNALYTLSRLINDNTKQQGIFEGSYRHQSLHEYYIIIATFTLKF